MSFLSCQIDRETHPDTVFIQDISLCLFKLQVMSALRMRVELPPSLLCSWTIIWVEHQFSTVRFRTMSLAPSLATLKLELSTR